METKSRSGLPPENLRMSCNVVPAEKVGGIRGLLGRDTRAILFFLAMASFAHADVPANKDVIIRFMADPKVEPGAGIVSRLRAGFNIQASVLIPSARSVAGELLDPESVKVRLHGRELETLVFYRTPEVAIVFALAETNDLKPDTTHTLEISAKRLNAKKIEAGWGLPIFISAEDIAARRAAETSREGATMTLWKANGRPATDATVFSQSIADLFRAADAEGKVVLDAPGRMRPGRQRAGGARYWTTEFDPKSGTRIELQSRNIGPRPKVSLVVQDAEGNDLQSALLFVQDTYFERYKVPFEKRLRFADKSQQKILILASGFEPKSVDYAALHPGEMIRLNPLPDVVLPKTP